MEKWKSRKWTALLMFVGAFCFSVFSAVALRAAPPSVWDGVYTDEQAKRGEALYFERCAACHGSGLEGGDVAPALNGGVFTSTWNDLSVGDLFERIRVSMPLDRPMTLSRVQTADVTAFLLKANKWPAGSTELPRELPALNEIKIQALKP